MTGEIRANFAKSVLTNIIRNNMNWENLKLMLCPKCGKPLKGFIDIKCQDQNKCKFTIGSKAFDNLVTKMYKPKQKDTQEEENLSRLNNL